MSQRVLDHRYELIECIGGGGMADVYKARDQLLDRPVAVKILHDQFKSDEEFITKFHREAKAAARLSHPNIVNIYDVGEAEGDHYIVMEYVPGRTLKDKIKAEGHLPVDEALRITREIASALAHAHANNLVHCDIKPHNILMAADGTAKVADFGIARAVTESTMTYSGNVIGSVHYFSPEQARGTMITPKSDVYSLGVVLYEMLTGKLPFTGETPVSVAMKHLQEAPVPVRQINPSIPPVVESIVSRMMSKDPDDRPDSDGLVQEIEQAEQMIGSGSRAGFGGEDPYATRVMPAVQPRQPSIPPRRAERYDDYDEEPEKKSIFKSKKFIVGLIAVLLLGFFVGAFMSYGKFWSTAEVVVPDVTGKQMVLAKQILEDNKLRVNVVEKFDADKPAGTVVSQDPEAGSKVKEERLVTIYVSKGGEDMEMPDLTGLSKDDAVEQIKKMGLKVGKVYEKYSDEAAGTVIETSPRAGSKISKGKTVDLTISKGKKTQKVLLTDVTGSSVEAATAALENKGFRVSVQKQKTDAAPAGTVIRMTPGAGSELDEGSTVTLTVAESAKDRRSEDQMEEQSKKNAGGNAPSKANQSSKGQ